MYSKDCYIYIVDLSFLYQYELDLHHLNLFWVSRDTHILMVAVFRLGRLGRKGWHQSGVCNLMFCHHVLEYRLVALVVLTYFLSKVALSSQVYFRPSTLYILF